MAIPPIKETYQDRLYSDEDVAGLTNILNLDPDVNVKRGDYQSLSDAYNYYLGGGLDASQADFPISEGDIAAQSPISPVMDSDRTAEIVAQQRAAGVPEEGLITNFAPTVEQTAAMEDIGAIPSIMQDPMTGDASIAEAIAAQDRQDALNQTIVQDPMTGDASIAEQIAAQNRQEANVTPEAQNAWQKVQSGLASTGDFIQNYGMATYNFLAGNIGAGVMGLATGPVGLGLTAAASSFQKTPEQKAMQSAAQASGIASLDDPRKDIYGKNIVSAFGDYDQSVADSIATLEKSGANPEKLAQLKNYQNEKAKTDALTITTRDDAIGAGIAAADDDSGADMFESTAPPTLPGGYELPADERELGKKTTALDLAKNQPVYNETTGNYEDADGNIIDDPRKAEVDIALAGLKDMSAKDKVEFNKLTLKDKMNKSGVGPKLTDEEKKKLDELQKKRDIKPKVQKTSLVDLTGKDDTTPMTPDEAFAETGDYDVFSDTPTSGPTVDIADIGAEDEEDYSAPTGGGGYQEGPPGQSGKSAASSQSKSPGHPSNRGGGNGGGDGCFLKGTPITMADGSTKPVEQVDLGDKVAEGGKVFAAGRFLVNNLYDYKGIKVSGSHMVNEDGNWTRIEDSKQGKPLGDDEHTVYVFGAENRRILINGILFTDYFEVKEQKEFLKNEEDFFKNWKKFSDEDHKNNVNILNAS